MRRNSWLFSLSLAVIILTASPAQAGLLDLINDARGDRPPVARNMALTEDATDHVRWMWRNCICHDTSYMIAALDEHAPSWQVAGEVLGAGPSLTAVVEAWLNSESHRRIVRGDWTHVGFGILRKDGEAWVVAWFYR